MSLLSLNAQKIGGFFDHVIEVEKYTDFAPDYLTVIDNHVVYGMDVTWYLTFSPDSINNYYYPTIGDAILEVNSQSTKGMTPEQFYQITDTARHFTLQLRTRKEGLLTTQSYSVHKEPHLLFTFLGESGQLINFVTQNEMDSTRETQKRNICSTCFSSIHDTEYDFSNKTYAYQIVGDDPLTDKKILDEMDKSILKKDTLNNPDLLFAVEKGQENGKAVLKLIALDARKLKNKKLKTRPIVWQETIIDDGLSEEGSLSAKYIDMAGFAGFIPNDRYASNTATIYRGAGIKMDGNVVISVPEGAPAAFLQPWDEIIALEYIESKYQVRNVSLGYSWFYPQNKDIKIKKADVSLYKLNEFLIAEAGALRKMEENGWEFRGLDIRVIVTYKRNGKKMQGIIKPKHEVFKRQYLLNNAELKAMQK
jgi:hypothetical protein